ncbi:MAG: hypothetical protein K0S01_246 [Herbinix sp.]|nr:hypothetical protein [Herbinix sp.]
MIENYVECCIIGTIIYNKFDPLEAELQGEFFSAHGSRSKSKELT